MPNQDLDQQIRIAAFAWLGAQKLIYGDILPYDVLTRGFEFAEQRIPIIGPSGIWKPAAMPAMPLSITTIPGGPYDDDLRDGAPVIHYRYRGTDPQHRDNVGLREAFRLQVPLVYCYRISPGRYLATYPVFVAADNPSVLTFDVQLDDSLALDRYEHQRPGQWTAPDPVLRRQYATVVAKARLHQAAFRDRVLGAYDTRCTLCRLRHASLLDAAHIIPDGEELGEPVVSNGLALCKIHHAAYDQNFISIRPDYKVDIRPAILEEFDGPMLQHGIKELQGQKIVLPSRKIDRPSPELLEIRHTRFLAVADRQ